MIVSHSNMKSFDKCPMKFFFDVKLNLRPKVWPAPVEKGILGHNIMEQYFLARLQGATYDEAAAIATAYLGNMLTAEPNNLVLLEGSRLLRHVLAFGAYFDNQPWKILDVEQNLNWLIEDDAEFGFTPDIICEWTEGPKRGLPFVLDYKFTGQYWTDRQLNLVQQMPKYLIYYNKLNGTKMRHAGVVMLNTRAKADDKGNQLFLLKWLPVTKEKLQTIESDNEKMVRKLEPYFQMTPDEYKEQIARRTTNEEACKTCWYADDICPQDFNGQDITRTIEANYVVNDYGYN